jgi:hypothetical protein
MVGGTARRFPAGFVLVLCGLIGGIIIIVGVSVRTMKGNEARAAREAAEAARATEAERFATEKAAADGQRQPDAKLAELTATAKAKSAAMNRATRDKWLWQCHSQLKCEQWQVDAIIQGAPEGPERERAFRVSLAAFGTVMVRELGKDGTEFSLAPTTAIVAAMQRPKVALPCSSSCRPRRSRQQ